MDAGRLSVLTFVWTFDVWTAERLNGGEAIGPHACAIRTWALSLAGSDAGMCTCYLTAWHHNDCRMSK